MSLVPHYCGRVLAWCLQIVLLVALVTAAFFAIVLAYVLEWTGERPGRNSKEG